MGGAGWRVGLAVMVLGLGGCAAQEFQVTSGSAVVLVAPKAGAAKKDTLLFGQRLKVRPVMPWKDRSYWERVDGGGFVSASDVAPYPLTGVPRLVAVDRAPILAPQGMGGGGRGVPRGAVTLGEQVEVVEEGAFLPPDQVALVKGGMVRGLLERSAVSRSFPPQEALHAALKKMLALRQLDAAETLSRNALALKPDDTTQARLLRQLLLRRDESERAEALKETAGEDTPLPALPGPPLVPFAAGYVGAAHAALHKAPRDDSPTLAVLAANHPVAVMAVDKGYARVRTQVGDIVAVDAFGDGRVSFPGGRHLDGYVRAALLTSTSQDEEALLSRAQAALGKQQPADALVLATRAYAMRPRDATRAVMLDAAFATGRFDVLLSALFPQGAAREGLAAARLLLGCAGDLSGVSYIHAPQQSDNLVPLESYRGLRDALTEPGFCLSGVDPRPPCAPRFVPPDCSRSLVEEECLEQPRVQHADRVKDFNAHALPRHQTAQAILERALGKSPSYLAFRWAELLDGDVMALLGQRARTSTFTVYALPITSVALGPCEAGGTLLLDEVDVRVLALPRMVGTSARHIFLQVPRAVGLEYGAALATPDAVRAWLRSRPQTLRYAGRHDPTGTPLEGQDPAPPFPLIKVRTPPAQDCAHWCVDHAP